MSAFDEFKQKHGKGEKCESVSNEILEKYAKKLPSELLDEWQKDGWCAYGNGLLWTINPADYKDILGEWIDITQNNYAFVRTAFADIYYTNGSGNYHLDTTYGGISEVVNRIDIVFDGTFCNEEYVKAVLRKPLFDEALSKLGMLERDECYGFFPALALGGEETIDYLRKVKIREYLSILSQM